VALTPQEDKKLRKLLRVLRACTWPIFLAADQLPHKPDSGFVMARRARFKRRVEEMLRAVDLNPEDYADELP